MSKAWLVAGLLSVVAGLGGCSDASYYVDASGNYFHPSRVKCITAPVGYVVPDDIYTAKYGQPWEIRCKAGQIPAAVIQDPDGDDVVVPVIPKPKPPKDSIYEPSVFANSTNLDLGIGAGATWKDSNGVEHFVIAGPTVGSSADGLDAYTKFSDYEQNMNNLQNTVRNQVDKDLGK